MQINVYKQPRQKNRVRVCWNDLIDPYRKKSGWSKREWAPVAEDRLKKDVIFNSCLLLYVCIDFLVLCHDCLHLVHKYKARTNEVIGVQEVIDYVIRRLKTFRQNNGSHIWPPNNSERIFFVFSACQLLNFPLTPRLCGHLSFAIAQVNDKHLHVSSSSRTINAVSILSRKMSRWVTKEIYLLDWIFVWPYICSSQLRERSVRLLHNGIRILVILIPLSNFYVTSTFTNRDATYLFFSFLRCSSVRGDADKSLARPTSRCRRTESIVSFKCRIASLFLLQRLKGSTSGDSRDFNNIETRDVVTYFLQGKAPKEIHAIPTETLGEHASTYATVKNWVAQFKRGDFSTCDTVVLDDPKQWPPWRLSTKFTS